MKTRIMKNISILFAFLALFVSSAGAEQTISYEDANISIPSASGWGFDSNKSNPGYIAFSGKATASGILQIYWLVTWECEECPVKRNLQMRFFPDAKTLLRLPSLQNEGAPAIHPDAIDINNSKRPGASGSFSEEQIKAILKDVNNIPDNFFKYRERFILLPVTLQFSNLVAAMECNSYYFQALFLGIKEKAKKVITGEDNVPDKFDASCGPIPYDETFHVKSRTSGRVEVRSSPDIAAGVSHYLENDSVVLKLKTINDDWLYIQSPYPADAGDKAIPGYIHKPGLMLRRVD
jgi:hypothetical protein